MANWPDNLVEIMSHDNPDFIRTVNISIWLAPDVKDVTHDARKKGQFLRYAPDIRQIGLGLLRERRGETWGGLLVRALEANESKIRKRCLQYIYVWTKQKSAVSFLWMVTVPFLMGAWGFFILSMYDTLVIALQQTITTDFWGAIWPPSDIWLLGLATGGVTLPLLASSLWDHRWDMRLGSGVSFRSTTLLIPYSLSMWLVPLSWVVPALILGITVVIFLYWLLDQLGIAETSHPMDYLPVFVWINSRNGDEWEFEKAYWDRFHYNMECKSKVELNEPQLPVTSPDLKFTRGTDGEVTRIRLQMDNPWHSVRPGGYVSKNLIASGIIGLALSLLIIGYVYQTGRLDEFPDGLVFVLCCAIAVLALRTIVRIPSELMPEKELNKLKLPETVNDLTEKTSATRNHLSEERLKDLWNLVKKAGTGGNWIERNVRRLIQKLRGGKKTPHDTRPRFVVITKLQDPFNFYNHDEYYNTFRDDLEYLYKYITNRGQMTEADRRRSVQTRAEIVKTGRRVEPRAMAQIEAFQMAQTRFHKMKKMGQDESVEITELPPTIFKFIKEAPRDVTQEYVQRALYKSEETSDEDSD